MLRNFINELPDNKAYWTAYISGGIFLLCIALYYQFVLDELPCMVCIQMRLWITLLVIVAAAGLLLQTHKLANRLINFLILLISAAMIERSYLLLGTERGFVFADCGFELGLPTWFAIEEWLPWLYRIETSCGYTPEIIFGVTIAEALMVISVLLSLISGTVFLANLLSARILSTTE
jgi:disulfide bond formation protein DsbB